MNAIINIGLVLQKICEKKCAGFSDASKLCRTSPKNFHKLAKGELPRLDAVQRICRGLGITERELIIGMSKAKSEVPGEVVEIKKGVV